MLQIIMILNIISPFFCQEVVLSNLVTKGPISRSGSSIKEHYDQIIEFQGHTVL